MEIQVPRYMRICAAFDVERIVGRGQSSLRNCFSRLPGDVLDSARQEQPIAAGNLGDARRVQS